MANNTDPEYYTQQLGELYKKYAELDINNKPFWEKKDDWDWQKLVQPTITTPDTSGVNITMTDPTSEEILDKLKELKEQVDAVFNLLRLILTTQLEEELKRRAKENHS